MVGSSSMRSISFATDGSVQSPVSASKPTSNSPSVSTRISWRTVSANSPRTAESPSSTAPIPTRGKPSAAAEPARAARAEITRRP